MPIINVCHIVYEAFRRLARRTRLCNGCKV